MLLQRKAMRRLTCRQNMSLVQQGLPLSGRRHHLFIFGSISVHLGQTVNCSQFITSPTGTTVQFSGNMTVKNVCSKASRTYHCRSYREQSLTSVLCSFAFCHMSHFGWQVRQIVLSVNKHPLCPQNRTLCAPCQNWQRIAFDSNLETNFGPTQSSHGNCLETHAWLTDGSNCVQCNMALLTNHRQTGWSTWVTSGPLSRSCALVTSLVAIKSHQ